MMEKKYIPHVGTEFLQILFVVPEYFCWNLEIYFLYIVIEERREHI
jgi:hypothetical protein